MKFQWIILSFGIACLTACDSPKKAADESTVEGLFPVPTLNHHFIEAESCEGQGDEMIDGMASGLGYVNLQSGSYQPVVCCDIPVSKKPLSVWLRHKGGALQVKTSVAGEQQEGPWVSGEEDQFAWSSFGEIPASSRKDRQIVVIGNNKKDQSVSIDCILFSEALVEDKDSLLTPLLPVSIDPTNTSGDYRAAPELWGVNLFSGGDPETLADPGYIENLTYLAPHLVRVHNAGKMDDSGKSRHGLLDLAARTWDEAKVRVVVVGLLDLQKTGEIIINIPNWPEWMDEDSDGFLDNEHQAEYVALVGRFAEIVWEIPTARERVLFEITNERDNLYHSDLISQKKPHRVAELARIFLKCAAHIREVAPGAKVGGPSVANSYNIAFQEQFIAYTAPSLDFYSMHFYVSGDPNESDSLVLSRADAAMGPVKTVKEILTKNSKGREIPISVNEYNIAWSWETSEPRMTNGFGAVWDAWFMMSLFSAGADSAAAWNENDGIYGKFSPDNQLRPASRLCHVLNTEFAGPIARLDTGVSEDIAALTTQSGDRLLIAHRGLRNRKLILPPGRWTGWMLGKNIDVQREVSPESEIDLPGITLLYLEK